MTANTPMTLRVELAGSVRDWAAMLLTEIDHVAIAVRDLEAAIDFYARAFGATVDHREVVESDGVEEALLKVADSYVQLLTPTRDDSPVAKAIDKRGEGIHHVGYRVADCAAALEAMKAAGATPIDAAPRPGSRGTTVAFIHPKGSFGTLIELVQEALVSSVPAAVLWDMDGTLIDTEPYWIQCEHELVARYGGRWTDDDAKSIIGFDLMDSAEVLRARGGVPLRPHDIVDQLSDAVAAMVRERIPWRPGARELLAALKLRGVPCALVTMSWKRLVDEVLQQLPPQSFQAVITGDMVMNGKPHPEPYRRAAEELGVDPLACVAIEDSPTGVASAEAAGCVVVAVRNLLPIDEAPHRVVLSTLQGVTPELLGEYVERTPAAGATTLARRTGARSAPASGSAPVRRPPSACSQLLAPPRPPPRRRRRLVVRHPRHHAELRPGPVQRPRLGAAMEHRERPRRPRAEGEHVPPDLAVLVRGHRRVDDPALRQHAGGGDRRVRRQGAQLAAFRSSARSTTARPRA